MILNKCKTFIKYLLCANHCIKKQGYKYKSKNIPFLQGAYRLMGKITQKGEWYLGKDRDDE